jgi:hypothetical protein
MDSTKLLPTLENSTSSSLVAASTIACEASLLFKSDSCCFQLDRWIGSGDMADVSSAMVAQTNLNNLNFGFSAASWQKKFYVYKIDFVSKPPY